MKLNLAIFSVLSLSSWWQQPLGETNGLRCKNRVIGQLLFYLSENQEL